MTVSTLYRWPASAQFGRVVPKTKFYEHGTITKAVRDKFVAEVQRITWAYKLADATIRLAETEAVPEIQVFVIDGKAEDVSDAVLAAIDKAVWTPIIFEINRGQGSDQTTRMAATHKQATESLRSTASYFSTGWIPTNAERSALPTSINLSALYDSLISPLLPLDPRPGERLVDTAVRLADVRKLDREIASIDRRLRNEPQFNRKVELRRELRDRTVARDTLTSSTRPDTDDAVGKEAKWTS